MTQLIFMGDVCFELGWGTRDLEQRCGNSIVRDVNGMRCVPADLVQEMILERDAERVRQHARQNEQHARDRALAEQRREQAEDEQREREARAEKQRPLIEAGLTAAEVMMAREHEAQIAASDERTAEFFAGNGWTYHQIKPQKWDE